MIGKLLVVDDEAWFREGLVKLISSNQLGWEVVGEASDGEEALAAIETFAPDLVITDINMPVMDGLALTEWIAQSGHQVMVIILTGYREFEYAQRAVRYGAIEFLLKPFSLDEAYRVLRTAYERFCLKKVEKKVRQQEQQINLFKSAVFGLPYDDEAWRFYNCEWAGYSFCVLKVANYYPEEKAYTQKDIGLLHYAVSNIISELLQRQNVHGIWFPLKSDQFAFLLEPIEGAATYRKIVQQTVGQFMGIEVCWLDGGRVQSLEDVTLLYQRIRSDGSGEIPPNGMNPSRSYPLKEEMVSLLITSNLQGAEKRIKDYLRSASTLVLQECKTEVYTLITAFSDILMTDFKHLKAAAYEDLNPAAILELHNVPDLLEWANGKSKDFIGLFAGWMQETQDHIVQRAKLYISNHYREACTLQTVSAHVHVTPNYLSNLFKKETGIGFTNYVSQLRIDKAKSLLIGTRFRMVEIAEQTGFDNSSYFTAVFKQQNGISPSEFRKQNGICFE